MVVITNTGTPSVAELLDGAPADIVTGLTVLAGTRPVPVTGPGPGGLPLPAGVLVQAVLAVQHLIGWARAQEARWVATLVPGLRYRWPTC